MHYILQTKLRKAASDALQIQDASNLSGVVHSFSAILTNVLWPIAHDTSGMGTDQVNRHPISKLFANKIACLSGISIGIDLDHEAFQECEKLSRA